MTQNQNRTQFSYQKLLADGYQNAHRHPAVDRQRIPPELITPEPQSESAQHDPSSYDESMGQAALEQTRTSPEVLAEAGRLAASFVIDGTTGIVLTQDEAARGDRGNVTSRY